MGHHIPPGETAVAEKAMKAAVGETRNEPVVEGKVMVEARSAPVVVATPKVAAQCKVGAGEGSTMAEAGMTMEGEGVTDR